VSKHGGVFNKAVLNVVFAVGGGNGGSSSKNNSLKKASPPKVGSPKKSVEKRKSPSQGNGGIVIQLPLLP
jgi:hypothetical protein